MTQNQPAPAGQLFGREPALWLAAIVSLVSMAQVVWPSMVPDGLAVALTAVLQAAAGVWVAMRVRPIAPTVFATLIATLVPFGLFFGLDLPQTTVSTLQMAVAALVALLTRAQQTPTTPEMRGLRR